jgi:acyl-CoA thioesterase FadM
MRGEFEGSHGEGGIVPAPPPPEGLAPQKPSGSWYEYTLQIGVSHIGKDGLLKPGMAMDLLQNATWFQMDRETPLLDYFEKNHSGMYLVSRQIDIHRLPAYGETVRVKSWVRDCDRLFGYRHTALYDASGGLCLGSYAVGAFVDLDKGIPGRIPQEVLDTVTVHGPLDMEILPRKIPVPEAQEASGDVIKVQSYHLDNYGHMNNARYVDIASAYIPEDFLVRRIRAEYKTPALPGDLIFPSLCRSGKTALVVALNNKNAAPYTVLEFTA